MICISIYTDRVIPFQAVILSDTPSNNVMGCEGDRVVVAVAVVGVSSAEHVVAEQEMTHVRSGQTAVGKQSQDCPLRLSRRCEGQRTLAVKERKEKNQIEERNFI